MALRTFIWSFLAATIGKVIGIALFAFRARRPST
jgi:hypothetical protein